LALGFRYRSSCLLAGEHLHSCHALHTALFNAWDNWYDSCREHDDSCRQRDGTWRRSSGGIGS